MQQDFAHVVCHALRDLPAAGHDRDTLDWTGREVARLMSLEYTGIDDGGPPPSPARRRFHVPDQTLTRATAAALGIAGVEQMLGGIVPFAFVATKVISHPLVGPGAAAATGWSAALGESLAGATLPGYTAFHRDDAGQAYQRLCARGPVRLKLPDGIGGSGQWRLEGPDELARRLDAIDDDYLARHGVVLELHVEQARTFSIGEMALGDDRIAYHGTQRNTRDAAGCEVYAGSELWVRRGGLADLLAAELPADAREAALKATAYDRAVADAYPGLRASRRNYDVVCGLDPDGLRMAGVLEQSWRIGGATPAELAALEYLREHPAVDAVRASTGEVHDSQAPPAGADVFYAAPPGAPGPRYKFRTCVADAG